MRAVTDDVFGAWQLAPGRSRLIPRQGGSRLAEDRETVRERMRRRTRFYHAIAAILAVSSAGMIAGARLETNWLEMAVLVVFLAFIMFSVGVAAGKIIAGEEEEWRSWLAFLRGLRGRGGARKREISGR